MAKDKHGGPDTLHKCEKCGKKKKNSEGRWILNDSTYCCRECCGDPKKGDHKKKAENFCEFC